MSSVLCLVCEVWTTGQWHDTGRRWHTCSLLTWDGRYLKYSNIAAKALRASLKGDAKVQALKREETILKVAVWSEGKQGEAVCRTLTCCIHVTYT